MKTFNIYLICMVALTGISLSWNEVSATDKNKKSWQGEQGKKALIDSESLDSLASKLIEDYLDSIERADPSNYTVRIYNEDGTLCFEGAEEDLSEALLNCEYLFQYQTTTYYLAR